MRTRLRVAALLATVATTGPSAAAPGDDLPPPLETPGRGVGKVGAPVRVLQALVPGATYEATVKGTISFDGVDERMGPLIQSTGRIRLNYAFEAVVERTIVANDGSRVVEDRHFRTVRMVELGSDAHNFQLKPGPAGALLLDALELAPIGGEVRLALKLLHKIASRGGVTDQFVQLQGKGFQFAGVGKVDSLTGKTVRITYDDGEGVTDLRPVRGEITPDERDFHLNSVVVSDCLIFPDVNIPVGGKYRVPGGNFGNVIDPSLLAHLSGDVAVRRRPDVTVEVPTADGRTERRVCVSLEAYDGRLEFRSGRRVDGQQFGAFQPTGTLVYDPEQSLVVEARLSGTGEFTRIPKQNLLRDVKQFGTPTVEFVYSCRRVDR
jgi:hypothetical protein